VAPDETFSQRALVNAIFRLRQRLEPDPSSPRFLVSHRAKGYALCGARAQAARPLNDMLWSASRHVGELLDVDDCVIYARDGNHLVQAAAYGTKSPAPREIANPLVLRVGEGIVGAAAELRRTEVVRDTRDDARYIDDCYPGRSELCVPILRQGELIGVIDTESPDVDSYGDNDARLVESVAQLIAAAAIDLHRAVSR
jgi:putative methionine-R-sulfoxide reductase with GAF domain